MSILSSLSHFTHVVDGTKNQLEEALLDFSRKSQTYSSQRFMDEFNWGPSYLLSPRHKNTSGPNYSLRVNLQNSVIGLSFISIRPGASCHSDFNQPRFVVADLRNLTVHEKEAYFKEKFYADMTKIVSAGPAQQSREIGMLEKSKSEKIIDKFGLVAGLGACAWCAVQTGVGIQQTTHMVEAAASSLNSNAPAPAAK